MSKYRYKNYMPEDLLEAYTRSADDPEKLDMSDELGLLRSVLSKKLEQSFQEEELDDKTIRSITTLVDKIAKIQTAISDHETKMNHYIHVRSMPIMIEAIGRIIKQVVQDDHMVEIISDRIKRLPVLAKSPEVIDVGEE